MATAPGLKLIGYWITSIQDDDLIPPQLCVSRAPSPFQAKILHHLENAQLFETDRGFSWCRFDCGIEHLGHREFSDGHYVWPEGLPHYVRNHNIALPPEFIQHILDRIPPIPKSQWPPSPPDLNFWKSWSRLQINSDFKNRLLEARKNAEIRSSELRAEEIAKMESKEGLSDQNCLMLDCPNRALVGRALCAACSSTHLTNFGLNEQAEALSQLLRSL